MRPKTKTAKQQVAPVSSVRILFFAPIALVVLVLVAYGNSLSNGFVWDDHLQIMMNPGVKPGAPLLPLLTTDARFANYDPANQTTAYRPLQMLTYRATVGIFGESAAAFHAINVAFAVGGVLAAFWMFWLLTKRLPVAFSAAALFAVHPVHTEAVDWIAALPDLGCGLFVVAAFALHLRNRRVLSVVAFAVSLLWKETALVFPVLLSGFLLPQPNANRLQRSLKASAPYWAVVAMYLGVRTAVLGAVNHSPRTWMLNPGQFLVTMAHLLASYWLKLLVPVGLNAYYVFHPIRTLNDPRGLIAVLFMAALGMAFYLLRRVPLAVFAMGWVMLTLLPALNLNALGRNAFAERYLYLPSVGFCLLLVLAVVWLLEHLPAGSRKPLATGVLIAVLVAFTVETIERNVDWMDDATLFAATLPQSQDSPFVLIRVASTQADEPSEASFAEHNYQQAIDLALHETPLDRLDAVKAYQGIASVYADHGQFDQALAQLELARNMAPNNPDADGEEGIILAHAGRGKEAEPLLERARAQQPPNENVLTALGLIARDDLHDLPRAATLFTQVLAAHSEADDFAASTHNNLGAVYGDENNYPAAIEQFRQAVNISPADPEFHMNLASSFAATGKFPEAREQARIALQLAPNDPGAQGLLGRLQSANP